LVSDTVSALGVIALAVGCLGVVGLVTYSVAQRTREIGIRLALGAESRHILRNLSTQFLGTIIGGLVVGVLGAAGLASLSTDVLKTRLRAGILVAPRVNPTWSRTSR